MSRVWLTSDLHFGHKNIGNFRKEVSGNQENVARISSDWHELVHPRDTVWILGDVAFTDEGMAAVLSLPGQKNVVLGNHDKFPIKRYAENFHKVFGITSYHKYWLSHAPIHPDELRGKVNIHGHVHYQTLRKSFNPNLYANAGLDRRYFNCCVENLWKLTGKSLILFTDIQERTR